jgi:hypothetical protein
MKRQWSHFRRLATAIIGAPVEVVCRAARVHWTLEETVTYWSPDREWSLTARKGKRYDSFTYAPNLRRKDGQKSHAAAIHDEGWDVGLKDDGLPLTFDENNAAFRAVLDEEGHPEWVCDLYEWGVSLPRMRRLWREKHGHE